MITAVVNTLDVTVRFSSLTSGTAQHVAKVIVFTTTAGDSTYTASDVSELSRIVGKDIGIEIFKVEMDGSDLLTSSTLVTWNDVSFTINGAVTISGGERIIIFYY